MRLAFFCSSLEPGRDGVGDYTRRLAAECAGLGHEVTLVALHDPHVSVMQYTNQTMNGFALPTLRLPGGLSWTERMSALRVWLQTHPVEWISLQFVAFGFHPKGLCFGLGKYLASLGRSIRWQIMFHELWLGLGRDASLKHRLWGEVQRRLILDLVRQLRPERVHTQTEPYRETLKREGIRASLLPLFGNIAYHEGDAWSTVLSPLIEQTHGRSLLRTDCYLAGVFGAVHPEWDAAQAIEALLPKLQRTRQQLVLVFLGKNHLTDEALATWRERFGSQALIINTGPRSDEVISMILQSLDLGLATTPLAVIQKSGSVAAMREHGLKILVTRNDWHLRGFTESEVPFNEDADIHTPVTFARLEHLPTRNPDVEAGEGVRRIAEQLLAAMEAEIVEAVK